MIKWNKSDIELFDSGNERIIDTKGFTPIEVRMQRLIESGYIAQFNTAEFDSVEEKELYLSDDYRIEPYMDLEEIQDVLMARNQRKFELIQEHVKSKAQNNRNDSEDDSKPVDTNSQSDDNESVDK